MELESSCPAWSIGPCTGLTLDPAWDPTECINCGGSVLPPVVSVARLEVLIDELAMAHAESGGCETSMPIVGDLVISYVWEGVRLWRGGAYLGTWPRGMILSLAERIDETWRGRG